MVSSLAAATFESISSRVCKAWCLFLSRLNSCRVLVSSDDIDSKFDFPRFADCCSMILCGWNYRNSSIFSSASEDEQGGLDRENTYLC